jgi:hypothetical protein
MSPFLQARIILSSEPAFFLISSSEGRELLLDVEECERLCNVLFADVVDVCSLEIVLLLLLLFVLLLFVAFVTMTSAARSSASMLSNSSSV